MIRFTTLSTLLWLLAIVTSQNASCILNKTNNKCINSIIESNLERGDTRLKVITSCKSNCECEPELLPIGNDFNPTVLKKEIERFEKTRSNCSKCSCKAQEVSLSFLDAFTRKKISLNETKIMDLDVPKNLRYRLFSQGNWSLKKPLRPVELNISNSSVKRGIISPSSKGVTIEWNTQFNAVVIKLCTDSNSFDSSDWIVIYSIRGISEVINCDDCECHWQPSSSLVIMDTIIDITVFYKQLLDSKWEVEVDREDYCTITDCTFICKEYFTKFLCYSTTTQVMIGVSFCGSVLTLLFIILYISYRIFTSEAFQSSLSNFTRWFNPPKEIPTETEMASDFEVQLTIEPTQSIPSHKIGPVLACLLIICLMTPVSSECVGNTIIDSSVNICEGTNCQFKLNIQFSLPGLGSSVCLNVLDKTSNMSLLGTIKITLSQVLGEASLSHEYYTSMWTPETTSAKYCSGTTTWCSNGCASIGSNQVEMFPTGPATYSPGVTTCKSSCGCAGCNCFFCDAACLYGRYSYSPFGGAYRVARISGVRYWPILSVEMSLGNLTLNEEVRGHTQNDKFDLTVIGEIGGDYPQFEGRKIVNNFESAFWVHAADYGNPTHGVPGDIQGAYHENFEVSPFTFSFPFEGWTYYEQPTRLVYQNPLSGVRTMQPSSKLPLMIGTTLWSFTGDTLSGIELSPGTVTAVISTSGSYTFTANRTVVCPVIKSINVTGCFNCPIGGTISIQAKSSCDSGTVQVELTTANRVVLLLKSMNLQSSFNEFLLPISSLDKSIEGTITIKSYTNSSSQSFIGVLQDPPSLHIDSINLTGSKFDQKSLDEMSISEWWDSLTGPLAVAKYVILVVVSIVIIVIVFILLYAIYSCVKPQIRYSSI